MSFFKKLVQTLKPTHSHVRKVLKGGYDAMRGKGSILGGTPLGTKISNAITGRHDKPITDQYGGMTGEEKAEFVAKHGKGSLGYEEEAHAIGSAIGSYYAAGALGKGLGALGRGAASDLGASANTANTVGRVASTLGRRVVVPALLASANSPGGALNTDVVEPPGNSAKPSSGVLDSGASLPVTPFSRTYVPYTGDYNTYGMGPEHNFYPPGPSIAVDEPTPIGIAPPPRLARGGNLGMRYGRGGVLSQFVSGGTGAGGREDNIDAKLSENEYVIDAETVSLLGDGNPEAGAKKLDAMREQIRRHKGAALARGKISPNAHGGALQYLAEGGKISPIARMLGERMTQPRRGPATQVIGSIMQASNAADLHRAQASLDRLKEQGAISDKAYRAACTLIDKYSMKGSFAEGGKVGALGRLFQRLKPQDPDAGLRRIRDQLDQQLAQPKREITPLDLTEHFDEMMRKRDALKRRGGE